MHHLLIQFPDIRLQRRDAHKLRGYFAKLFRDRSTLLHNHFEDGRQIYRYPLVQYKVIDQTPTLLGINEGAQLLIQLFLEIKEIELEGRKYPVHSKNISSGRQTVGVQDRLQEYAFINPWMALNQKNFQEYLNMDQAAQTRKLDQILCSNILSFYKGIDHFEEQQILVKTKVRAVPIQFKNKKMLGFKGTFFTNAQLPDAIGLGKSVARGFGAIRQKT